MKPSKIRRQRPLSWVAALVLGGLFVVLIVTWTSLLTANGDDPPVQPAPNPAARGSPEVLVERLSQSHSASPRNQAPEDALVAHGEAALPALERALRLGLRGHEAQAFIDSRTSKRCAVVRVLDRIPGERSTDLLVRALADHPDNYAMRDANLRAVEKRDLSNRHLEALLANPHPKPALLALRKIAKAPHEHELRPLVERIHDPEVAARQLRNEYDSPNAMPRDLWEIRLLSGQVLGKDMLPEIRQRARSLVEDLRVLVAERDESEEAQSEWQAAQWEGRVTTVLFALHALGKPVRQSVQKAAEGSTGIVGSVLDMARFIVGDAARLDSVANTLTDSPDASLRHCAMIVLARIKDPKSKPALWKALHDPLRREEQSCIRVPGQDHRVYPIRRRAARTLIEMGVDEAEVRRRSPTTGEK